MSRYSIYLCPIDGPLVDPNPDCPNHEQHTPAPSGYVQRHEWAASMNYRGWRQLKCEDCDRYSIWVGGRP